MAPLYSTKSSPSPLYVTSIPMPPPPFPPPSSHAWRDCPNKWHSLSPSSSFFLAGRRRSRRRDAETRLIGRKGGKRERGRGFQGQQSITATVELGKKDRRRRRHNLPPNHQRWYAKMEAHLELYTLHFCTFCMTCMLSRRLSTKFLHRNSVGSWLRVRRWLGSCSRSNMCEFCSLRKPCPLTQIKKENELSPDYPSSTVLLFTFFFSSLY